MADYAPDVWVDDDGSGTTGTPITKARMDKVGAGVKDAAQDSKQRGPIGARPAASAATKNWLWVDNATDQLSYCDGAAWHDVGLAVNAFGSLTVPGELYGHGGVAAVLDDDQRLALVQWSPVVGTLSTNVNVAGAPGPSVTLDGGYVLDGTATPPNTRVLLLGQTNPVQNGLWEYSYSGFSGASSWARTPDATASSDFMQGREVLVLNGPYAEQRFSYVGLNFALPGVDSLTFHASAAPAGKAFAFLMAA